MARRVVTTPSGAGRGGPSARPVSAAAPLAAQAQSITAEQRGEIERIIKDYLLKNPEVLQEAIAELEKKWQLPASPFIAAMPPSAMSSFAP